MYTSTNFKSKKALKEAVASHKLGVGPAVTYFQPGGLFPTPLTGMQKFCIEGPHGYHTYYAECVAQDGVIIKVK
jgi:hypothetical protein